MQKVPKTTEKPVILGTYWQGHKDLNPEPTVLETAALPIELYPYIWKAEAFIYVVGPQGFEPGTIRLWAGGSNQLS